MAMTRRDVEDLYPSMRDAHTYIESRRDPDKKSMSSKLIQSLEVGAGAAGVGVLAGRLGTTSVGSTGIPLGLAIGAGAHALAFFGLAGRYDNHVHNFADGALAAWLTMWGAGQGQQMRAKAGEPTGPITAGLDPQAQALVVSNPGYSPQARVLPASQPFNSNPFVRPTPLSEAELQAMAKEIK